MQNQSCTNTETSTRSLAVADYKEFEVRCIALLKTHNVTKLGITLEVGELPKAEVEVLASPEPTAQALVQHAKQKLAALIHDMAEDAHDDIADSFEELRERSDKWHELALQRCMWKRFIMESDYLNKYFPPPEGKLIKIG